MNADKDYYGILGVMPTAEDVVIRAAYRALVQRYHPDRYSGPPDDAERRMKEINEAYAVLSDAEKRKDYDRIRGTGAYSGDAYFGDVGNDEPKGADPLERDWSIALKYYPDLAAIEQQLSRISWRLANTFRAQMLASQAFEMREAVAASMEQQFLETYFGTNAEIVRFARALISIGHKRAARALNETVRVLGSGVDPQRVITTLEAEFPEIARRPESEWEQLTEAIQGGPRPAYGHMLQRLVELAGGTARWDSTWLAGSWHVEFNGCAHTFTHRQFSGWVLDILIPKGRSR
jgi:curved DNA-binding protein CbpA